MPVPCQAVLVFTGTLIAAVGVVAILGTGCAVAAGRGPAPTAWIDSRPWLHTDRLRLARTQLTESVGPVGAFLCLLGGGVLVVSAVAALFGFGVAALEHPVDWWAFHLSDRLRAHGWARIMNVVTQTGNLTETRIAAAVFSVLLAFLAGRRRWWAPALLLVGVVLVEKYQQSMLATIVDRGHPPTTLGTYPSGGCARLISVYGAILFIILELTRAGRRVRALTWSLLWTAAFLEGYSRWYLNKHWVTDVLGGWFYGGLLLAVAVFAGRALLHRNDANTAVSEGRGEPVGTISRI
jgi:membrane-associated phospholipid phosphatase